MEPGSRAPDTESRRHVRNTDGGSGPKPLRNGSPELQEDQSGAAFDTAHFELLDPVPAESCEARRLKFYELAGTFLLSGTSGHWWCQHPRIMREMLRILEFAGHQDSVTNLWESMALQLQTCADCVDAYLAGKKLLFDAFTRVYTNESTAKFFEHLRKLDVNRIVNSLIQLEQSHWPPETASSESQDLAITQSPGDVNPENAALYEAFRDVLCWDDEHVMLLVTSLIERGLRSSATPNSEAISTAETASLEKLFRGIGEDHTFSRRGMEACGGRAHSGKMCCSKFPGLLGLALSPVASVRQWARDIGRSSAEELSRAFIDASQARCRGSACWCHIGEGLLPGFYVHGGPLVRIVRVWAEWLERSPDLDSNWETIATAQTMRQMLNPLVQSRPRHEREVWTVLNYMIDVLGRDAQISFLELFPAIIEKLSNLLQRKQCVELSVARQMLRSLELLLASLGCDLTVVFGLTLPDISAAICNFVKVPGQADVLVKQLFQLFRPLGKAALESYRGDRCTAEKRVISATECSALFDQLLLLICEEMLGSGSTHSALIQSVSSKLLCELVEDCYSRLSRPRCVDEKCKPLSVRYAQLRLDLAILPVRSERYWGPQLVSLFSNSPTAMSIVDLSARTSATVLDVHAQLSRKRIMLALDSLHNFVINGELPASHKDEGLLLSTNMLESLFRAQQSCLHDPSSFATVPTIVHVAILKAVGTVAVPLWLLHRAREPKQEGERVTDWWDVRADWLRFTYLTGRYVKHLTEAVHGGSIQSPLELDPIFVQIHTWLLPCLLFTEQNIAYHMRKLVSSWRATKSIKTSTIGTKSERHDNLWRDGCLSIIMQNSPAFWPRIAEICSAISSLLSWRSLEFIERVSNLRDEQSSGYFAETSRATRSFSAFVEVFLSTVMNLLSDQSQSFNLVLISSGNPVGEAVGLNKASEACTGEYVGDLFQLCEKMLKGPKRCTLMAAKDGNLETSIVSTLRLGLEVMNLILNVSAQSTKVAHELPLLSNRQRWMPMLVQYTQCHAYTRLRNKAIDCILSTRKALNSGNHVLDDDELAVLEKFSHLQSNEEERRGSKIRPQKCVLSIAQQASAGLSPGAKAPTATAASGGGASSSGAETVDANIRKDWEKARMEQQVFGYLEQSEGDITSRKAQLKETSTIGSSVSQLVHKRPNRKVDRASDNDSAEGLLHSHVFRCRLDSLLGRRPTREGFNNRREPPSIFASPQDYASWMEPLLLLEMQADLARGVEEAQALCRKQAKRRDGHSATRAKQHLESGPSIVTLTYLSKTRSAPFDFLTFAKVDPVCQKHVPLSASSTLAANDVVLLLPEVIGLETILRDAKPDEQQATHAICLVEDDENYPSSDKVVRLKTVIPAGMEAGGHTGGTSEPTIFTKSWGQQVRQHLIPNQRWVAVRLASLTTCSREYRALHEVHALPECIAKALIQPISYMASQQRHMPFDRLRAAEHICRQLCLSWGPLQISTLLKECDALQLTLTEAKTIPAVDATLRRQMERLFSDWTARNSPNDKQQSKASDNCGDGRACNVFESLKELPESFKTAAKLVYNDSQLEAIGMAVECVTTGASEGKERSFLLLQGPPGTGKTRTVVGIISALSVSRDCRSKVASRKSIRSTTTHKKWEQRRTALGFGGSTSGLHPLGTSKGGEKELDRSRFSTGGIGHARAIIGKRQSHLLVRNSVRSLPTGRVASTQSSARSRLAGIMKRNSQTRSGGSAKVSSTAIVPGASIAGLALASKLMGRKRKFLVCAPSNGAVDELTARILSDRLIGLDGRRQRPSIVRVGVSGSETSEAVQAVCLDALVEERLHNHKLSAASRELADRIVKAESMITDADSVDEEASAIEMDRRKAVKEKARSSIRTSHERLAVIAAQSRNLRQKIRKAVLEEAAIVCATLSSSALALLQEYAPVFDAVIVDEAAQATEVSCLIPFRYRSKAIILVGDPRQLPATVLSKEASRSGLSRSLFERLEAVGWPVTMLTKQYRMHPVICDFPSKHFYQGRLTTADGVAVPVAELWLYRAFDPFVFFDLAESKESKWVSAKKTGDGQTAQDQRVEDMHSFQNVSEAVFIAQMCQCWVVKMGPDAAMYKIGIIAPYKRQVRTIRQQLRHVLGRAANSIHVNTVDGFQGREKDIIIFSCVRGGSRDKGVGFLSDSRRMNVAITRAKYCLWVVGHCPTLQKDPNWAALISHASEKGRLVHVSEGPFENLFEDLEKPEPAGTLKRKPVAGILKGRKRAFKR